MLTSFYYFEIVENTNLKFKTAIRRDIAYTGFLFFGDEYEILHYSVCFLLYNHFKMFKISKYLDNFQKHKYSNLHSPLCFAYYLFIILMERNSDTIH